MAKIPTEAKKVFTGVMFDVYQWSQKMFDGGFKTFEMIKRPNTVNVIMIDENGKILLAREQQPGKQETIGCFGGRVEAGEDILLAAKRELLEETGYSAQNYKLWFETSPSEKIDWTIYTFLARDLKKISKPTLESGERIVIYEVSFDELINETIYLENFRDKEILLKMVLAINNPDKLKELRVLFSN